MKTAYHILLEDGHRRAEAARRQQHTQHLAAALQAQQASPAPRPRPLAGILSISRIFRARSRQTRTQNSPAEVPLGIPVECSQTVHVSTAGNS
ncbi:MAG: hypothetical protein SF029_21635 [bacterium]|nr:hypothetical protein [bacterium]